jgi:putative copper resistance protein D
LKAVPLLQVVSVFVMNVGFTGLIGSWLARHLIALSARPSHLSVLRRWDMAAAGLALFGSALSLWAATAVMADTGLAEAAPMIPMMLTKTAYGHAGALATAALALFLVCRFVVADRVLVDATAAFALLGFAAVRGSMGHAGEDGWFSLAMLAETVHYLAAGVWTGLVAVSGWLVLRMASAAAPAGQWMSQYLHRMSQAATVALGAILATGLFSAWHRIGSPENLLHTAYGTTLQVKLGLVLLAIALGGYNKYFGLPGASQSARRLGIVRRVLQVETIILYAALAAAAALTSQQPPAAM